MRKLAIVLIGGAALGGCGGWLRTPRADGAARLAAAEAALPDESYSSLQRTRSGSPATERNYSGAQPLLSARMAAAAA